MYLLYCGLLVTWLPLLWPVFHLKSRARSWLLAVIAAGIAALIYEIGMFLGSSSAIRLDILLISMALGCLYGSAAVLLYRKHWRVMAALLTIVLILIGGAMISKWVRLGHESQRLGEVFRDSNVLLFKAKFRDPATYESYFGPFSAASASHPTGHWQIVGQSHFTRLIINAHGRVWLFFQCQEDAECHSGPQGSGLRKSANNPQQWTASLKPQAGLAFEIEITQIESDILSLKVRDKSLRFAKAPPPVNPASAPQSLRYLGSFTKVECSGAHATVRQVWLWRDGERSYATGLFSTLIAGRHSGFNSLVLMGEGAKENDGWHFAWNRGGRSGTAIIALDTGDAVLTLEQVGRNLEDADRAALTQGAVFRDERIDLAPLTASSDWRQWFDTVLVGHFISGKVPAC